MFQTEYYVAGIQPFGDALAILAWSPDVDVTARRIRRWRVQRRAAKLSTSSTRTTRRDCDAILGLALAQVPSRTADSIGARVAYRWWTPGRNRYHRRRRAASSLNGDGREQYIDWLAKREDYVLVDACEIRVTELGTADVGRAVSALTARHARAARCAQNYFEATPRDGETWVEKFMLARQLPELQLHIPTEDPELSANTYQFAYGSPEPSIIPGFLAVKA